MKDNLGRPRSSNKCKGDWASVFNARKVEAIEEYKALPWYKRWFRNNPQYWGMD